MIKNKKALWGVLLLPLVVLALVTDIGPGIGHQSHTAEAASTLTVGLDMRANQSVTGNPGTYGATLPAFGNCADVKTSVNSGIFYFDVFALNTTNLYAFIADLQFTSGKMEILGADVKQFFGTGASVSNFSTNYNSSLDAISPPVSNGSFEAMAEDAGGLHTGSGGSSESRPRPSSAAASSL
jgi:hypothetical protein